jgi:hypothetical protein
MVDTTTINDSTTFTALSVIDTTPQFQSGGYTIASDGVQVPDTGIYRVSTSAYMTTDIARASVEMQYTINGSSANCADIASMGYIRGSNGHAESSLSLSTLMSLTAGDKIDLTFRRAANASTVVLQGASSSINIERIA